MAFMGLNPEKARTLSSALRQTGASAEDVSSEVTASLTLSQLESELPGQLVFTGEELAQLGIADTNGDAIDPLPHVDRDSAVVVPDVALPSPPRPGGPLADDDGDGFINSVDPDKAFPKFFPDLP